MRTKNALVVVLAFGMILQTLPPASAMSTTRAGSVSTVQQIDPAATYRLTNDYAGPGKSLTVVNNNNVFEVVMADSRENAGNQQWRLVSLGNNKYRLTTVDLGADKSLDTPKSGANYLIRLQGTANVTGQSWTLTPVGNGKFRLTNDYGTPSLSLDTPMSGNQYVVVLANTGNVSGQMWSLTKTTGAVIVNIPGPTIIQPPARNPTPITSTPIVITGPTIVTQSPTNVPASGIPVGPTSSSGTLVTGAGPIASGPPLVVSGGPAAIAALNNSMGQALCIKGGAVSCGNTKADWIGTHTLNMNCSRGIYDPIWGGTCWEAPEAGKRGAWIRSTTAVTKPDAFWRIPTEELKSAETVKGSTPFAWDCPSGSFWDGYNGGACYKCPDTHPRRTANHISGNTACASDKQEASAIFVKYNGCPTPDAAKMKLAGKRTPGRPFLEIGSGCYACPTTDEEGNILITQRSLSPVAGASYDNNTGCTILMKWKPAAFIEPGLAGIAGFQGIVDENLLLTTHAILTVHFEDLAKGRGHQPGTAGSKQLIEQMWNEVAANPTKSVPFATLMYGFLEAAIVKEASQRTAAETAFVNGFSAYVTRRRTFIAEQALAMYDAWKAAEPTLRSTVAQSQLQTMFYYGTVPLDFESAAAAGFGLASVGLGTATAVAASAAHIARTVQIAHIVRATETAARAHQIAEGGKEAIAAATNISRAVQTALGNQRVANVFAGLSNFRLLAAGSQLAMAAGPLAISIIGSVLISIAIDQFIEIATARDKLNNAVEIAKQPTDLNALLALADGRDQLAYFWARAIEGTSASDSQIRAHATRVAAEARTANYQLPPVTNAPASTTPVAPVAGAAASPFAGLLQEYTAATSAIVVQPSSTGFNGIWGLEANGTIKRASVSGSGQWTPVGGGLSQIAAGFDNSVFGTNASGQIWQWTGTTWKQLPGGAVKVSVHSANRIAAVNGEGAVWTYDGASWTMIATPVKMIDVAIGSDGYLFAVGVGGQIFRSSGPVTGAGSAGWTWNQLPGGGAKIVASTKDLALTVNHANELWIWKGGTWSLIGNNFTQVAMTKSAIWGLSTTQGLVRMDASGWTPVAAERVTQFAVAWNSSSSSSPLNRPQ